MSHSLIKNGSTFVTHSDELFTVIILNVSDNAQNSKAIVSLEVNTR